MTLQYLSPYTHREHFFSRDLLCGHVFCIWQIQTCTYRDTKPDRLYKSLSAGCLSNHIFDQSFILSSSCVRAGCEVSWTRHWRLPSEANMMTHHLVPHPHPQTGENPTWRICVVFNHSKAMTGTIGLMELYFLCVEVNKVHSNKSFALYIMIHIFDITETNTKIVKYNANVFSLP